MPQSLTKQDFVLRDFRFADIPAMVELFNEVYPDEPTTVESEEHWEHTYPQGNPRMRLVAETVDGWMVGLGDCMRPFWLAASDVYSLFIAVPARWRRRGVGRVLLAELEPFAWAQGAGRIHTDCREDFTDAIHFLEEAGYTRVGIRFESRLDLETFDETRFADVFERVAQAGYALTTLAAERLVQPDADRMLYEIYHETVVEVPLPGGEHIDQNYDTWRSGVLESPTTDPAGIFIARQGDRFVGMTYLELLKDGPAITGMTGVAPEHRGRGLALALKLLSFRYLKEHGYRETRAHNDTANPPILHLNEKLGYQRLPGWLVWEKPAPRVTIQPSLRGAVLFPPDT